MSRDLLVSVEGNLYSVPARYVGAWVEVQAGPGDTIDIYHEVEVRDLAVYEAVACGEGSHG